MKTLLQIDSSIFGKDGASSRLGRAFRERWLAANPGARVIERDLAAAPVPHLTADAFAGFGAKPGERTAAQEKAVRLSDTLIEELRQADVVVIGLPMYNFGVPSALKAYFDHVARAGVTFRYASHGPEGLLAGKKAYVLAARGGAYAGTAADHETPWVRQILSFLGITDVEVVYAEGLASEAKRTAALESAGHAIERLAEEARREAA